MELGKVQFGQLAGLIKSGKTFEDLDVNKDGKIDSQDQEYLSNIQNALAGILNEQDEDSEINDEDLNNLEFGEKNTKPNVAQTLSTPTRTTGGNTSAQNNSTSNTVSDLQNRMVTLSMQSGRLQEEQEDLQEELEDKKAEQEKIEKEILSKQQEYALLTNEIQNSQDNDSSKTDKAERLAGEMTILQGALENLVSDIAEIEKQYQNNATQLQTLNTQIQTLQSQTMQLIEQEKQSAEVTNDNAQVEEPKAGYKQETTPVNQPKNANNVNPVSNNSGNGEPMDGETVSIDDILSELDLNSNQKKKIRERMATGEEFYIFKSGNNWVIADGTGKSPFKYESVPVTFNGINVGGERTTLKQYDVPLNGSAQPVYKITDLNDDFTSGTAEVRNKFAENATVQDILSLVKEDADKLRATCKDDAEFAKRLNDYIVVQNGTQWVLVNKKTGNGPEGRQGTVIKYGDYGHTTARDYVSYTHYNLGREAEAGETGRGIGARAVYEFSDIGDDLSGSATRSYNFVGTQEMRRLVRGPYDPYKS